MPFIMFVLLGLARLVVVNADGGHPMVTRLNKRQALAGKADITPGVGEFIYGGLGTFSGCTWVPVSRTSSDDQLDKINAQLNTVQEDRLLPQHSTALTLLLQAIVSKLPNSNILDKGKNLLQTALVVYTCYDMGRQIYQTMAHDFWALWSYFVEPGTEEVAEASADAADAKMCGESPCTTPHTEAVMKEVPVVEEVDELRVESVDADAKMCGESPCTTPHTEAVMKDVALVEEVDELRVESVDADAKVRGEPPCTTQHTEAVMEKVDGLSAESKESAFNCVEDENHGCIYLDSSEYDDLSVYLLWLLKQDEQTGTVALSTNIAGSRDDEDDWLASLLWLLMPEESTGTVVSSDDEDGWLASLLWLLEPEESTGTVVSSDGDDDDDDDGDDDYGNGGGSNNQTRSNDRSASNSSEHDTELEEWVIKCAKILLLLGIEYETEILQRVVHFVWKLYQVSKTAVSWMMGLCRCITTVLTNLFAFLSKYPVVLIAAYVFQRMYPLKPFLVSGGKAAWQRLGKGLICCMDLVSQPIPNPTSPEELRKEEEMMNRIIKKSVSTTSPYLYKSPLRNCNLV